MFNQVQAEAVPSTKVERAPQMLGTSQYLANILQVCGKIVQTVNME